MKRYRDISSENRMKRGKKAAEIAVFLRSTIKFLKTDIFTQGFRDRSAELILAFNSAFGVF